VTQSSKSGRLLVVGTPIGNLEDLSPRGRKALAEADAIFCEDTRVTAKLAARFGLPARRISCPGPREESRVEELLGRLSRGETVALVSDAGMPTLSDPGARLVEAAAAAGHPVVVVPGPSAPAAALALSGLPAVPHTFLGFLPARQAERARLLETLRERRETLVWFESPHRLPESLESAARILGPRRACVARELTKIHEEAVRGTLSELAAAFRARGAGRGEITIVVEGLQGKPAVAAADDVDAHIREALAAGGALKALSREIARRTNRPAREIYARAVALRARETGNGKRETGDEAVTRRAAPTTPS
jgi:16S rRNA (cytidine1402-2'-O)-methyltransferase